MMQAIRWAILDDYAVVVVAGRPDDHGFDGWLRAYGEVADNLQGLLVHASGAGPDTQQRGRLTSLLSERNIHHQTAVLCDSILLRGVVNAINWFQRSQTTAAVAFAPSQLDKALDHIAVPRGERARIASTLADLIAKPVKTRVDAQAKL